MSELSASDIEECQEMFQLYDFWGGKAGTVDGAKIIEMMRCLGYNPTSKQMVELGATVKPGEKQYKFEEILPIYQAVSKETDTGTFADFMEAFKTFDREGQGFISMAELQHVIKCLGERLTDEEVEQVLNWTDTQADLEGNIKYEDFIKKVMAGQKD